MTCARCEPLISRLLDGELAGDEARAVEAHVAGCERCRLVRRELAAMIEAARGLRSPEPPPALWARIEARLDERPARRSWLAALRLDGGWWRYAVPSLAAAALALGVTVKLVRHAAPSDDVLLKDAQSEFARAEEHYARAIAGLRTLAGRERERWPEERRLRYDRALAALDEATLRCRDATSARPADPDAEELLFGSYRRQIAFLEESLMRGAAVGP